MPQDRAISCWLPCWFHDESPIVGELPKRQEEAPEEEEEEKVEAEEEAKMTCTTHDDVVF